MDFFFTLAPWVIDFLFIFPLHDYHLLLQTNSGLEVCFALIPLEFSLHTSQPHSGCQLLQSLEVENNKCFCRALRLRIRFQGVNYVGLSVNLWSPITEIWGSCPGEVTLSFRLVFSSQMLTIWIGPFSLFLFTIYTNICNDYLFDRWKCVVSLVRGDTLLLYVVSSPVKLGV